SEYFPGAASSRIPSSARCASGPIVKNGKNPLPNPKRIWSLGATPSTSTRKVSPGLTVEADKRILGSACNGSAENNKQKADINSVRIMKGGREQTGACPPESKLEMSLEARLFRRHASHPLLPPPDLTNGVPLFCWRPNRTRRANRSNR